MKSVWLLISVGAIFQLYGDENSEKSVVLYHRQDVLATIIEMDQEERDDVFRQPGDDHFQVTPQTERILNGLGKAMVVCTGVMTFIILYRNPEIFFDFLRSML